MPLIVVWFCAGMPVGSGPVQSKLYVRCSDPNVICESRIVPQGEPHDVFVKVSAKINADYSLWLSLC